MSIEDRIKAALQAQADTVERVPPRQPAELAAHRRRWLAPVLAVAAVLIVAAGTLALTQFHSKPSAVAPARPSGSVAPTTPVSASVSASRTTISAAAAVHIKLLESDGAKYGVGMPIVAYFSKMFTDGSQFAKATEVTVNGAVIQGGWYFETSAAIVGYPLEGHYRPTPAAGASTPYWPANASIALTMSTEGVSAGGGLAFDDDVSLRMSTGDAHISYVDCGSERMTVTSNGVAAHAPLLTSCGAPSTPTSDGIKVVQQLGEDVPGTSTPRPNGAVEMVGGGGALGRYDLMVPWSVRLTSSGEYVHAAAWNGKNIGARSTSDGCTNLNTPDAQWFYGFSQVGDVVVYTNTGGPTMQPWDGFGDWNLAASAFDNTPPA